ncbi:hypothetical protein Prudu_009845 [Prunus dulcis]|uniref:Reverse transcriptase Ty1/copia-type domain-containing protein n=1 Tax=Prunus dulcis TaxID=3755 RepID=A0A4Y1R742_PRUDU|nr:hypothetical protein Prudu_009845 [Prunus dulcis]
MERFFFEEEADLGISFHLVQDRIKLHLILALASLVRVLVSVQCQICWKYGHTAIQCYHRGNFSYQGKPPSSNLTAMHANCSPSSSAEQFWVADTGATAHMTSDLSQLSLATPFLGNETITTAGVQDKLTGSVLLKGLCRAGLYSIPFFPSQPHPTPAASLIKQHFCFLGHPVNTSLWHKRFGHPSNIITTALLHQSQFSASLKVFQSDGGGEYLSHKFQHYLLARVSPFLFSSPSISFTNTVLSPIPSLSISSPSPSTYEANEPLTALPPSSLPASPSATQPATQSPLPVDPDFQPESLRVVLPLPPAASQSPEWQSAMREEIEALHAQGTWDLVPLPAHKNLVGCKWVYRIKKNADGSIARHKARLVAKGFSQEEGIDYYEPSVRLKKSLYGLKQAPRAWNERFTSFLPSLGFQASNADPSLFIHHSSLGTVVLLLYVDDIILTGSNSSLITSVISALTQEFDMKDLGQLTYFLGLQISYQSAGLFVSQTKYIKELLDKTLKDDGKPYSHPEQYRSIVGALQYLTFTRPDIAFSVNQACQFMHNPMESHVVAVKRILRYLKGTIDFGIWFKPGLLHLHAYSDADWAGDPNDRRSVSEATYVSRSSTEAEYRALAIAAAELAWIRQLFCDLHVPLHERVIRGDLHVQHVSSADQFADILTKGLSIPLFQHHCSNLMLGSSKHEIEGACKDIKGPNSATCQKIEEESC